MFLTREKFLRLSVMVLMVPIMFFGAAQANQNDGPDVTPAQRVEVEVAPIDDVAAPELTPELTGEPVSEPTQQTPSHPCDLTPYSDEDILADRIPGDSLADLAEAVAAPHARLSKSDEEVDMKPGMMVTIDIIGKKRSVLNYIFTPLNRAAGVVFREN